MSLSTRAPFALLVVVVVAACGGSSSTSERAGDPVAADGGSTNVDASVAPTDSGAEDAQVDGGSPPALAECPMGPAPNLPPDSPRILVIAPSSYQPTTFVQYLQGLLAGDPSFQTPEVVLQLTDKLTDSPSTSLMGFWYSLAGRDARLASLDGPFNWVVMLEDPTVARWFPELYFEGVRTVACRVRAAGAKPVVLQTWTSAGADTATRGENAYRVANGTGSAVVPAGYAWEIALQSDAGASSPASSAAAFVPGANIPVQPPPVEPAFVAAASVYSAITGKSAATTTYVPENIASGDAARFAAIAQSTVATHDSISHYTAPYASTVQRRTLPTRPELRFMSSGTSSEALWTDRMNEIVPKLGMIPKGTAIGACNELKAFDTTCLATADASFADAQYSILFAREYVVSSDTIATSGTQNDLQVQVWDRHYDSDPSDGAAAVASLDEASREIVAEAQTFGLAWIPYHLMFAKLKTARPSVQLTSDGVHATFPVSYGLAAMSLESRTSLFVPTTDLDADTTAAVRFADETVRQLSSLSQSGVYVPDDPTIRPKVR